MSSEPELQESVPALAVVMPPGWGGGRGGAPPMMNRKRRLSVSAESFDPTKEVEKKFYPKSEEQKMSIFNSFLRNPIFKNLESSLKKELMDSMFCKGVSKGEEIIKQGDIGDFFYVVEEGSFIVTITGKDGVSNQVAEISKPGSFGELALMYNAPRAATVIAAEESSVWSVDRETFQSILLGNAFKKRETYRTFLKSSSLLKNLTSYELDVIADELLSEEYSEGDVIIEEGDEGDLFYFLETGSLNAMKVLVEREGPVVVKEYHPGDYFGELALIKKCPRQATIIAKEECSVLSLDGRAFVKLLGPVETILKRNMESYRKYEKFLLGDNF